MLLFITLIIQFHVLLDVSIQQYVFGGSILIADDRENGRIIPQTFRIAALNLLAFVMLFKGKFIVHPRISST